MAAGLSSGSCYCAPSATGSTLAHVLVIDDEPVVLRYVRRSLRLAGYSVCAAHSGAEGIACARECRPDVIVCDVSMPDMDGHAVLQALRAQSDMRDIPFIFLTGRQSRADMRLGMQLGADDYLAKPFRHQELIDAVRSRLERHRELTQRYSVQLEDVTQRLEQMTLAANQRRLQHGGNRLLDRHEMDAELRQRIASLESTACGQPFAILRMKDADRIYSEMGHAAVDELFRLVARRMLVFAEGCRDVQAVGHIGAQRFTVVLGSEVPAERLTLVLRAAMEMLEQPYVVRGCELFVQFAAGLTLGSTVGERRSDQSAEELSAQLMLQAESSVRTALARGRSCLETFQEGRRAQPFDKMRLEADLHYAVGRDQLRLVYQPQVDLENGDIVGFEALVRWEHPELGLVPPGEFIGLAEQNGTILGIGEWVLRTACQQMASWREQRWPLQRIAVNVSAVQLEETDLVGTVEACLRGAGLDGHCLQLELTETVVLRNLARSQQVIEGLRRLGVSVAIDDFGIGYSSLSYLRQLKFDSLKIDRSFVQGLEDAPDKLAIIELLLDLSGKLGFSVTAEGIETAAARDLLVDRRCRYGQGYFFAKPLPLEAIERAVREHGLVPGGAQDLVLLPRPIPVERLTGSAVEPPTRLPTPSLPRILGSFTMSRLSAR